MNITYADAIEEGLVGNNSKKNFIDNNSYDNKLELKYSATDYVAAELLSADYNYYLIKDKNYFDTLKEDSYVLSGTLSFVSCIEKHGLGLIFHKLVDNNISPNVEYYIEYAIGNDTNTHNFEKINYETYKNFFQRKVKDKEKKIYKTKKYLSLDNLDSFVASIKPYNARSENDVLHFLVSSNDSISSFLFSKKIENRYEIITEYMGC